MQCSPNQTAGEVEMDSRFDPGWMRTVSLVKAFVNGQYWLQMRTNDGLDDRKKRLFNRGRKDCVVAKRIMS